jgi:NAD-dependent deacetylase sirtuin 2
MSEKDPPKGSEEGSLEEKGEIVVKNEKEDTVSEPDSKGSTSGSTASGNVPESVSDEEEDAEEASMMEKLRAYFAKTMGLQPKEDVEKVLSDVSVDGIVEYIKSGKCKRIIAMVGAGISTSAGIPDFRSPGSGLYANLAKYNLPAPEAIFDINFFKSNPEPFFSLAKELFPGKFNPTPCHYFLRLLHEKGLLSRLYSQNIDTLERRAGVPGEKLVEAHGTFYSSHCLTPSCNSEYDMEWMKERIFEDTVPSCDKCNALVKPDIIFFGESLPSRFFRLSNQDFPECDLLIVIGTSLTVQPFASLIESVPSKTPRLLINKTKCGHSGSVSQYLGLGTGLQFDSESNYRDVMWLGSCDELCQELATKLGWSHDLEELMKTRREELKAQE